MNNEIIKKEGLLRASTTDQFKNNYKEYIGYWIKAVEGTTKNTKLINDTKKLKNLSALQK